MKANRPTVTFELEGHPHPYSLKYDFNVVCDVEAATGANLMRALAGGQINAAETRGLLYALLKPSNPDLLLSEAGALLDEDMETVLPALTSAIQGALNNKPIVTEEPTPE